MVIKQVIAAPPTVKIMQWTGDNYAEIRGFVTELIAVELVGEDLTVWPGTSGNTVIPVGSWMIQNPYSVQNPPYAVSNLYITDDDVNNPAHIQEIPGSESGPFSYGINAT
jgi:hypothetical protein